MDNFRKVLVAGALTAMTSIPASAVTIEFGANSIAAAPTIAVNSGGYSLTVSAKTVDNDGVDLGTGANVVQWMSDGPNDGGLGVISKPFDSNSYIDGGNADLNDLLILTFTTAVRIVGISFGGIDVHPTGGPDMAHFSVDGVDVGGSSGVALDTAGFPGFLAVNWVGTSFGISALGTTDEFLVRAIQVTPVPVPAAGLLFLSGIGGIAALGRRKAGKSKSLL